MSSADVRTAATIAPGTTQAASDAPTPAGLTSAEAAGRLAADGSNTIGGGARRTRLAILVAQVSSPLVLILVGAVLATDNVGAHLGLVELAKRRFERAG